MKIYAPNIEYRIRIKPNKTEGIQNYDLDNQYPQRVRELVKSSGTASNCVKTYAKFIRGLGFKDQAFFKSRINKQGLTPDKLLRESSNDFALWQGFAWLVKYDILQNPIEVFHVPFEFCRLVDPENEDHAGQIAVYDDWDRQKRKNIMKDRIDFIDLYDPNKDVIREQIDLAGGFQHYKGQLLWYSVEKEYYPLAPYDPILEDIMTDAGIKTYRLRNTTTNFMPSQVFEYPGEFDTETEREEFVESLKTFQGTENSNKILLFENKNSDTKPLNITKFDVQDNDKMFQITRETAKNAIIEVFSMPPILAGVQVAGKLGNAQDLADAREFYNDITSDERLIMEEKFTDVFSRFQQPINTTGDYSIVPLAITRPTTEEKPTA